MRARSPQGFLSLRSMSRKRFWEFLSTWTRMPSGTFCCIRPRAVWMQCFVVFSYSTSSLGCSAFRRNTSTVATSTLLVQGRATTPRARRATKRRKERARAKEKTRRAKERTGKTSQRERTVVEEEHLRAPLARSPRLRRQMCATTAEAKGIGHEIAL